MEKENRLILKEVKKKIYYKTLALSDDIRDFNLLKREFFLLVLYR